VAAAATNEPARPRRGRGRASWLAKLLRT
jgi:hypothetical protein